MIYAGIAPLTDKQGKTHAKNDEIAIVNDQEAQEYH